MMRSKFILLLAFLTSFLSNDIKAQDIDMEQTLDYINGKLRPVSELTVDRGIIVSRYFKNGQIVREDQVMCKDLDISSINYDNQAGILSINCKTGNKCVDRQMFIRKIQRDYARISFPVKLDSKSSTGIQKAFKHMISLVLDPKYKSSEPFE
ncbi:MAG: hypothetical protein ACU4F9_02540 [Arcticibacter sp.]|jgi:hypothetical protein